MSKPDPVPGARARMDEAVKRSPNNAIALRPLAEIVAERREPEWLLHKILERNVLAVLSGPRGTFKSFVGIEWSMRAALDGHGVVILSGEGGGLGRRAEAWMKVHAPDADINKLRIVALEKPLNLNQEETRKLVADRVAALPWKPAVILIDTLSKFAPGMKENDADAVSAFLSGLTADLRDDLHCTVLLVAHSGHDATGRPRGSSVLMCNPDAEYIVNRPGNPPGMTVTVTRERFKDTESLPPLAYTARVIDLGRTDKYGQPVTSLVVESTDPPPASTNDKAKRGKNQDAAVAALTEWCRVNSAADHITSIDMIEVLKNQGLTKSARRREVIDWLTVQRIVTPAVGGFTVHREMMK